MPTLSETWYVIARDFDLICTALRTGSMKFNIGVLRRQKCSVHNPDRSAIGNEGRFTLKPTLAAAQNSALRGCKFCKVITRCLECFTKGEYDDSTVHFDSYYQEPSLLEVWLPDRNEDCNVASITIELHIKDCPNPFNHQTGIWKEIPRFPDNDGSVKQIEQWIDTCAKEHMECATLSSTAPLPKRVIDVLGSSSYPLVAFLYEPKTNERGAYVALSHCWGDQNAKPLLRTTHSTLTSRQNGIEWTHLSKTFRDAITITRKLRIRYLWIDSLCIIQDDEEEWEQEAMNMGSIYENAYLVLAATAAWDGDGGCIFPRPTHEVTVSGHTILAREFPKTGHNVFVNQDQIRIPPLFTRGWAYQERLLATRILHFCSKEMIWECKSATHCECGHSFPQLGTTKATQLRLIQAGSDRYEALQIWNKIVEAFTCCSLTYDSDRLPALSSLAEKFASSIKPGRYLSGLWEEFLIEGLQWRVKSFSNQQGTSRLPSDYYAPSWSWASVVSPIAVLPPWHTESRKYIGHKERAKIIGVDNVLSNPKAPFGSTIRAELRIHGLLTPAVLDTAAYLASRDPYQATNRASLCVGEERLSATFDTPVSVVAGSKSDSYYLFWLESWYHTAWDGPPLDDYDKEVFLVLQMNTGPQRTFKRVGLLSVLQSDLEKWWPTPKGEETIIIL